MIYKNLVRPVLLKAAGNDPEKLHKKFLAMLQWIGKKQRLIIVLERFFTYKNEALQQEILRFDFRNPIALAAGFDKNAAMVPGISVLGVGFHEIGTITPEPRQGFDERPRIHYLAEDEALINKMGLPNLGSDLVSTYLKGISSFSMPLIVNVGEGVDTSIDTSIDLVVEGYVSCLETFYPLPIVSAISIDVSCPHMLGFSELRDEEYFEKLVSSLREKTDELETITGIKKPILVKISPDDNQEKLNSLLDICLKYKIDGIIAVNTTNSRQGLRSRNKNKDGGLSGKPLFGTAVDRVRYVYKYTKGTIPIIGVGGIFTSEDAYQMIKAGASLVQVYTGFVYQIWKGPFFFRGINKGLAKLIRRDGCKHISEIVGQSTK